MKIYDDELYHFGIRGQKWGERKYQYKDGTYTSAGAARYWGPRSVIIRSTDKFKSGIKKMAKGAALVAAAGALAYGTMKYHDIKQNGFDRDAVKKAITSAGSRVVKHLAGKAKEVDDQVDKEDVIEAVKNVGRGIAKAGRGVGSAAATTAKGSAKAAKVLGKFAGKTGRLAGRGAVAVGKGAVGVAKDKEKRDVAVGMTATAVAGVGAYKAKNLVDKYSGMIPINLNRSKQPKQPERKPTLKEKITNSVRGSATESAKEYLMDELKDRFRR